MSPELNGSYLSFSKPRCEISQGRGRFQRWAVCGNLGAAHFGLLLNGIRQFQVEKHKMQYALAVNADCTAHNNYVYNY